MAIDCACATVDHFASTLASQPGIGTGVTATVDEIGVPIDRADATKGRVAATIDCVAETIDPLRERSIATSGAATATPCTAAGCVPGSPGALE